MRRKLQQKIEELESVEARTPEQEDELKKARRELSNLERELQPQFRAPECRHENADLGDKFCRDCSVEMAALPLKAVSRLIAEEFERRGIGVQGEGEGEGSAAQPTEEQLREQYKSYNAAADDAGFAKSMQRRYHSFSSFRKAGEAQRNAELAAYGVPSPWRPAPTGKAAR